MSALRERTKEIKDKTKVFLEEIKPEEKIGLVFHDDLDGFASGRLFYEFLVKRGCNKIEIGVFGIGKSNPFGLDEIKNADKLIILDLGPNLIYSELSNLNQPILYIDHHPKDEGAIIKENVIEWRTISNIPVSRTSYDILESYVQDLDWFALAGVLFDKGELYPENKEFISQILKRHNFFIEDFNEKIVYVIVSLIIYFEDNLKKAFFILSEVKTTEDIKKIIKYSEPIEREIERFANLYEREGELINGIHFFYFEPKFSVKSIVITKISSDNPGTFIFATPEGECLIRISARDQSREVDVAELLKNLTNGFEDSTAGGHAVSAGAVIKKQDFQKFKERLKNFQRR